MSRIPKLPSISSREKENIPGFSNGRNFTRTVGNGLSDVEKKNLLINDTKPMIRRTSTAINIVPAPRIKRVTMAASIEAPTATKSNEVGKNTVRATAKIPPYDYKARFNDLLEKHKTMKSELTDLKDKHSDVSDEYEKHKETVDTSILERDLLKEKLFNALKELKQKNSEFDRLKLDFDSQKHELEDLLHKSKLLKDVTYSLKSKTADHDKLKSEHENLYRRYKSLQEENEALRILADHHLKKGSSEHDKLQLDHKDARLDAMSKTKNDSETLRNILTTMYQYTWLLIYFVFKWFIHGCHMFYKCFLYVLNMVAKFFCNQRVLRNTIRVKKVNIRLYKVQYPVESEAFKPLNMLNVLDACPIEVQKIALLNSARKGKSQNSFSLDSIFTPHSSQKDVFAAVTPIVQSALDGYNVCIFAYGQTGSGKTSKMKGSCDVEQYDSIPRAINIINTSMEGLKRIDWDLSIKASFIEIYNETTYDLLVSSKDQESNDIKIINSKGTVIVSNLREEKLLKNCHDFIRLLIFAQRNRQTAATLNNERNLRSYSEAQIKISAIIEKRKEKTSNLNLVDLAGSEGGKTTQRIDETKHINRSLSELSKVILSLQTNQN